MNIVGTSALVTGGASGLGLATATRLHQQGARVVLVDLDADAGTAAADDLGDGAVFAHADVQDEEQVRAAVETAVTAHGGLDIAVNCAGIGPPSRIVGRDGPHSLDLFRTVVGVNLVGTFNVLRLAANQMASQEPGETGERGVIVNTASIAAFEGQIGQAAYSASKAGIVGMTLPIARDLARHAVRVATIAPGVFETPLLMGLPQDAIDALGDGVPYPKRLGDPVEYAMMVSQIIANPYLNGETIRLDGALRMT